MSVPTVLNPQYVVQRAKKPGVMEYFRSSTNEGETELFIEQRALAMVFYSLNAAARVAKVEAAEIRVLVSAEDAAEFGRG